jgi:hypothetical protein
MCVIETDLKKSFYHSAAALAPRTSMDAVRVGDFVSSDGRSRVDPNGIKNFREKVANWLKKGEIDQ